MKVQPASGLILTSGSVSVAAMNPRLLVSLSLLAAFGAWAATVEQVVKSYEKAGKVPALSNNTNFSDTACGTFGFKVHMRFPDPSGAARASTVHIEVVDSVRLLGTTREDLPVWYMSPGLWVGFIDPTHPDQVSYTTNGNPGFGFMGTPNAESMTVTVEFTPRVTRPTVFLNVARFFSPGFNERSITYNDKTREMRFTGHEGKIAIVRFSPKDDPFGFEEIGIVKEEAGTAMVIRDIKPNLRQHELPKLTIKDFEQSGLAPRFIGTNDLSISLIAPRGFPRTEKERRNAEQFRSLVSRKSR